jgi:hypothetical protein
MKKTISILLFVLIGSVFSFSQTPASDWQKFAPDGEDFIVEIPQKMIEEVKLEEVDEDKYDFISADYRMYFNGVFYFIFSNKLVPQITSTNFKKSDTLQSFINEFDKEPATIKFGDFNGIKYEFKDSEDFYHIILFVQSNNRNYRFHTIQEESKSDETARFWKSIHFFQEVLKPKTYDLKNQIISLNRYDYFNYPEGRNFPKKTSKPVQSEVSTPIKFTYRPHATYTDLARSYGLCGTIIFEVEFLANGEIGQIITLKRLPFGMTANAINAVKGIKFQPAIKDGVPVTVVKRVQYSFSVI